MTTDFQLDLQEARLSFFARGWTAFPPDAATRAWATAARDEAARLIADPQHRADWLRCGGTWFAGVNVFPNDTTGAVPAAGVPPLGGAAMAFVGEVLGLPCIAFDRAQISACYPGYPQPWEQESPAAFRFRRDRDAAHVDGLLRDASRRRSLGEAHAFILGLPLTPAHPDAAPMVVWEGSHEIMRRAFATRFAGIPPGRWGAEDITDTYWAARREAFENCRRVSVTVPVGGAYVVHRLALHGVAPWQAPEQAPEHAAELALEGEPRVIAYFRPEPAGLPSRSWWLDWP